MRALIAVLFVAMSGGLALAETPAICRVAESQLENSFALPVVEKAIAAKTLTILVAGSGSSQLPGQNGATRSYPARLQNALSQKLPGVTVKVTTDVKSRRTARDMLPAIKTALAEQKPNLLVWQTGTVDAVRIASPDEYSAALTKGVEAAKAQGSDVVLMNMQYSPRTESMIALGNYAESLR